jgi:hypothetical protein
VLEGLENCSPQTKAEEEIATHLQLKPMIRLACQTRVTGSVTVRRLVRRVESANKNAGTNFLISKDAYEQVGHEVEVNQCPPWEVRGKTGVFQLYEVVGAKVL